MFPVYVVYTSYKLPERWTQMHFYKTINDFIENKNL